VASITSEGSARFVAGPLIMTIVRINPLGVAMRVIAEDSLHMSDRDENGLHGVKDRYCNMETPCFSFDSNGRVGEGCEHFKKLPTGVKVCTK